MRLWTAPRGPRARHERHPTTVAGGPGPSTARTGRNYRPYGLAAPPEPAGSPGPRNPVCVGWRARVRGSAAMEPAAGRPRVARQPAGGAAGPRLRVAGPGRDRAPVDRHHARQVETRAARPTRAP